ncbi:MAG: leucine-rich repeat protein [Clostridia bacterium]|nr:leucine-rich repeat protein [Clostridia bacterium]
MKTRAKKTLSVLLSIVMLASVFAGMTFTASAASSGTCGANLTWTLNDDGLLTVSGAGPMTDYTVFGSSQSPFKGNTDIKTVVIGSGVTSIGAYAFLDCGNLTSAEIPDSVTSINEGALAGTGLPSVEIPGSVEVIAMNAFTGCGSLTSVTIPDGVESISANAFRQCINLATVRIPQSVTTIGSFAFMSCYNLTSVNIPDRVTNIGAAAFEGCISLTALALPSGVTMIGGDAFSGCSSLTDVYYAGSEAQWNNINIRTGNEILTGANIHYSSILFGSYPQSEVTDADLKAALDAADKVWASYRYYSCEGSREDGEMVFGDWMQFADFFCGGEKYRAVKFTEYRPYYTGCRSDALYSYQYDNGYSTNNVYYFKYEPLIWRVLDPSAGYIMCESIVDAQAYQNTVYLNGDVYYQTIRVPIYANDYVNSSIRFWLNYDFFKTAFTGGQKAKIKTTELNNDGYYTLTGDPDHTQYDSDLTNDEIFMLSYDEALDPSYGFSSDSYTVDTARQAKGTDYAECQGLFVDDSGCSSWWLRSPGVDSEYACYVNYIGRADVGAIVDDTGYGVRPACMLSGLSSDTAVSETLFSCVKAGHIHGAAVIENNVAPTCTAAGSYDNVIYCTNCGVQVFRDTVTVSAAGHTYGDTGDARFTCTVCGEVDNDLKAAIEELAAAKATLAGAIETAREYYGSIKDDYPVIADDLDTKLQQAEGVLANAAAAIDEVNSMIELAGTALDAAKETVAAQALIDAIGTVEYTAESKEKIDAARAAYDALTDAQKALVDPDAVTALNDASAAYALLKNKAAFADYRGTVKALADGMKLEGDSDACTALIEAAKAAVDAVTYDEDKTLDENKDAVDGAAALTQLAAALAEQRAAEADDPKEVFEEYRATLLTLAQALRRDGDSEAVTALIDDAVAALTGFTYDEEKTLDENEEALSKVLALFADRVKSQRRAERQEYLNHQPCSLCGKHHTGSLLENFIGVIHGIIWIMRSIALIAA